MLTEYFIIVSVIISVAVSHIIKELVHIFREGSFSWNVLLWQTGGMPSAHSAGISALSVSVFLTEGVSTIFWVSLVVAVLVVRDSFGVRRNVSDQAKMLNTLTSHVKLEQKVKVVLGHSPLQVLMGVILGVVVPLLLYPLI